VIEIILNTGDSAEADDPESAVLAARTLMQEAAEYGASALITASFYVDGKLVRTATHTL